ncbi:uncharacterized protein JN550_007913 [Neoarthrinium moseri]|uniref:uncharacterized protein n=1 Tax=Neoarthrinium moseri TaxID=1658444 RepID=UPI001FDBBE42|nr:uncharacterized protein JN550_007913 [Neoarthrinium moseri]KAI1865935.1 hypothetical protein JN550_007913 [Neoarthrinium moseri]
MSARQVPGPFGVEKAQVTRLEDLALQHFPGWLRSERNRTTSNFVWQYGCDIQNKNKRRWVCQLCLACTRSKVVYYDAEGLQNVKDHLFKDHGICAPHGQKADDAEKRAIQNMVKKRTITEAFGLDPNKSHEQKIADTVIRSFDKRIIQEFDRHKDHVRQVLQKAPGLIHISFDGWTARNQLGLYGIACFFRDERSRPCKIVLAIPEAVRHTGSCIGAEVLDIIDVFGIKHKTGYFTLDNAASNDVAAEVIGAELGFDGRLRRGRCIGHTINLSAKALLFGKTDDAAFEQQLSGAEALNEVDWKLGLSKGPVGKLHNLVVEVRSSNRIWSLLKEIQQQDEIDQAISSPAKAQQKRPLKLVADNLTRWLSQLYMIRRALKLKNALRILVVRFKAQWEDENRSKRSLETPPAAKTRMPKLLREESRLTDTDWDSLEQLERILTVYETVVKVLEGDGQLRNRQRGWVGSYGNVWDVVQGFETLLETLERYKSMAANLPNSEQFRIGINNAWSKLHEYYKKLDETPIYYAALALHPAYRWDYFETMVG